MTTLTGGPRKNGSLVIVSPDAADVGGGEYDPSVDRLYLAPNANRDVVAHEFGHRYDKAGRLQAMIPKGSVKDDGRHTYEPGFSSTGMRAEENAANTFSRAVQFLQSPISRGPQATQTLMALEKKDGGIGNVVSALLQEPIYARHPMKAPVTSTTAELLKQQINGWLK